MPKKLIDSSTLLTIIKSTSSSSSSSSLNLQAAVASETEHTGVIRRLKNKQQADITNNNSQRINNTKRFSCDELEILKERFVDFIKLDQNKPIATTTNNNTEVLTEAANTTTLSPLYSSSSSTINNLNKHLLIDNSINNNKNSNINNQQINTNKMNNSNIFRINNNNNNNNSTDNYQHLPLPDPPPQFLMTSEQNSPAVAVVGAAATTAAVLAINQQHKSYLSSRLSVISSTESNSGAEYSLSSSSSTSSTSNRPEPPQRTVSIRNSASMMDNLSINNDSSSLYSSRPIRLKDDCISIKSSSIYSSYRGLPSSCLQQHQQNQQSQHQQQPNQQNTIVRSSRSVFSIYEEEDETNVSGCPGSLSTTSSSSSSSSSSASSTSPYSNLTMTHHLTHHNHHSKLERLTEYDINRIESMYRSIGSIVHVSACTCDLYTTTSEQIANLLNECWNLEQNSIVPVWLFDTGLNPKRPKQLRLLFVDKSTAFPYQSLMLHHNENHNNECVIPKSILLNYSNRLKYPNLNENRLTFTLNNKQLICLIQFYDLLTCKGFFKFYSDLEMNPRNFLLFNDDLLVNNNNNTTNNKSTSNNGSIRFRSMSFRKQTNRAVHSQSMHSLPKNNTNNTTNNNSNDSNSILNRYSDLIDQSNTNNKFYKLASGSLTTGNLGQFNNQLIREQEIKIMAITKNCISNPCAFQHISSLKDDDQRIRFLIENRKS